MDNFFKKFESNIEELPELSNKQKEIVAKTIISWPAKIDSPKLIELLDRFAKRIVKAGDLNG